MNDGSPGRQSSGPATDWPALMAFGLGVLKLQPAAFWSMTPRELRAAIIGAHGGHAGGEEINAPRRAEFFALMLRFPDRQD